MFIGKVDKPLDGTCPQSFVEVDDIQQHGISLLKKFVKTAPGFVTGGDFIIITQKSDPEIFPEMKHTDQLLAASSFADHHGIAIIPSLGSVLLYSHMNRHPIKCERYKHPEDAYHQKEAFQVVMLELE